LPQPWIADQILKAFLIFWLADQIFKAFL